VPIIESAIPLSGPAQVPCEAERVVGSAHVTIRVNPSERNGGKKTSRSALNEWRFLATAVSAGVIL
jgi:hypothetical protein